MILMIGGRGPAESTGQQLSGDRRRIGRPNQLPALYEAVAKMGGAGFLNAGSVISTDGVDGLHLSAESERKLGTAIAEKVKEILK
jgi:hypothetical protein